MSRFIVVCGKGTFGEMCLQKCHCKQSTCNSKNGLCSSKCAEGWQGKTCSDGIRILFLQKDVIIGY